MSRGTYEEDRLLFVMTFLCMAVVTVCVYLVSLAKW